jgi:hypothetical protein
LIDLIDKLDKGMFKGCIERLMPETHKNTAQTPRRRIKPWFSVEVSGQLRHLTFRHV